MLICKFRCGIHLRHEDRYTLNRWDGTPEGIGCLHTIALLHTPDVWRTLFPNWQPDVLTLGIDICLLPCWVRIELRMLERIRCPECSHCRLLYLLGRTGDIWLVILEESQV